MFKKKKKKQQQQQQNIVQYSLVCEYECDS